MGYSAKVEMEFFVKDERYLPGQIGRDLMIFDQPMLFPATTGILVLSIDGNPSGWIVAIHPMSKPSRHVTGTFSNID